MKRIILLMLNLTAFLFIHAQDVVEGLSAFDGVQGAEVMWSYYDIQSNGMLSNRMYQKSDASVAVVSTMSHQTNSSMTDRGTGYNFCKNGDMSQWYDSPDQRIEANATGDDTRTGWPSIAPYGPDGEIVVCHTGVGLVYYTRTIAGEGEWNGPHWIPNPEGLDGQQYPFEMSWPRVATSGENNDIIHVVAAAQYNTASGSMLNAQFYCRSTDGENWDVDWSPLFDSNEHINVYSADDYAISTNGDNVAIVYSGSFYHHAVMYKSEDNGENWERTVVWENPYYGIDWNDENSIYTDTLWGPIHSSVAVDNEGVAHVALSVFCWLHKNVGTEYYYFPGVSSDGIAYWNENQPSPIQSPNGNPHDALRLWWKTGVGNLARLGGNVRFCGWLPPDNESGNGYYGFDSKKIYSETDYFYAMYGLSAYPSIAVDPAGNVAVAYSSPDMTRVYDCLDDDGTPLQYYYRSTYVSYKPYNSEEWEVSVLNLLDDTEYVNSEFVAVTAVSNPINENEFWFSCSLDDTPGFFSSNNGSQDEPTQNKITVFKVNTSYLDGQQNSKPLAFTQNENSIVPGFYQVIGDVNSVMELTFNLEVTNTTEDTMNVICEKVFVTGAGDNYFCWGQCYGSDVYSAELSIGAGETVPFSSHFIPTDENGELIPNTELKMEYHFYDDISDERYVFEVYYKYLPVDDDLLYVKNRNVVIEEFTGRACVFCPEGHMVTNSLMETYPGRVFAVNIHPGGSLCPVSYPNLSTTDGALLAGAFYVTGFPSGVVNRTTSPTDMFSIQLDTYDQLSELAEVNVAGDVVIDEDYRTAEITVKLYYTANSSESTNYLTVMMLQDSIWGYQSGGDYNPAQGTEENYCQMHVLRDIITQTWGEPVSPTTEGTYLVKKFIYNIPEVIGSPNGVEVDLNNIHFIAFVSERYPETPPTYPILNANILNDKDDEDNDDVAHHWEVSPNLYPNKMMMTAILQLNGVEQNNADLEVGAFCGDELRGSGRLQYVGYPVNRYISFMTLYGNDDDELSFRLYDHTTMSESDMTHQAEVIFESDKRVGNIDEPYVFNFCSKAVLSVGGNPNDAGIVTGAGDYFVGDTCVVTATPNDGFLFVNWTENGDIVSDDDIYSFVIEKDRNLIANFNVFEAPENIQTAVIDHQSIKITWNAVENVSAYNLYRDGIFVAEVQGSSYTDCNLESDTEYCYVVACVDDEVESIHSEEACAKTDNVSLQELQSDLGLYPNPADDRLFIMTPHKIDEINIYTVSGVLVLRCQEVQDSAIDIRGLTKGLYIVRVRCDNQDSFSRFVKE